MQCGTQKPLVLTQGQSVTGSIMVSQGRTLRVESITAGFAEFAEPPSPDCFKVGDRVHVAAQSRCCGLITGTYDIAQLGDGILLSDGCGPALPAEVLGGWLAKAVSLRGFRLYGSIATRNPSPPVNVMGCAEGWEVTLLSPTEGIAVGDVVNGPGVSKAIVVGIYEITPPRSSSRGECCGSKAAGGNGLVLTLDRPVATPTPCSSPARFEIRGRVLAEFDFEMERDCGRATYTIPAIDFDGLPGGGCGGEAYRIGCYQVSLVQGVIPKPGLYPPGKRYSTWRGVLVSGDVYLRQTLI